MTHMGDMRVCLICGTEYREIFADGSAVSNGCPSCTESDLEKRKRKYFEKLDAMTLEERVRRIEEMQFNQHNAGRRSTAFTKY